MFNQSNAIVYGGTFTNHHTLNLKTSHGIDRLEAATAPAAFHNSRERFDPPKCHPHTREAVLRKILDWIHRKLDTHAFVMWLYGAAGAGKSAIAQTIAEICHKEGLLLASFFFSRSDSLRDSTERLVATLAYQIIIAIPSARGLVEAAVENDPLIFSRSLDAQFTTLIVLPLQKLRDTGVFAQISPQALIILDGLDESMDGTRTHLLNVISHVPHLFFLIASRAEQDISTAIRFGSMEGTFTQIALDDDYQSDVDIELFFRDKFDEIKRTHPLRTYLPSSWPTDAIIHTLIKKSSGQFIYAATALKYVSSPRHRPTSRLEVILGISPPRNENDTPFAQLDVLYMHIISSSEDPPWAVRIISACLLFAPSAQDIWIIEDFLGLSPGDVGLFINDLTSIIDYVDHNERWFFRVLHASLGDFLFDASRSRQFHVDPQTMQTEISRWCLGRIIRDEVNPGNGLNAIDGQLWYWAAHHCSLSRVAPQLINDLRSAPLREKLDASLRNNLSQSIPFIDAIKNLKFNGAKLLYEEYLSIYDRNFVSYIDENPFTSLDIIHLREPQLLGLEGPHFPYNRVLTVRRFIFQAFSVIFKVPFNDQLDFILCRPYHEVYVHDFFSNVTRAGRYATRESHYTTSAEKSIEYLLDPHHIPIQGVQAWAAQSRGRPWIWRRRHLSIVKSGREHWRLRFWKKYVKPYRDESGGWGWAGPNLQIPLEPLLVVHIVLTILPPLLANATQGSTDLHTLCKELISGRLPFFIFPKESKAAKRAIEEYLSRKRG